MRRARCTSYRFNCYTWAALHLQVGDLVDDLTLRRHVSQVRYSDDGVGHEPGRSAATKDWTLTTEMHEQSTQMRFEDAAQPTQTLSSGHDCSRWFDPDHAELIYNLVTLSLAILILASACLRCDTATTASGTRTLENPAASKAWTLTSGDGTKRLLQVKDAAGLVSPTYTDNIVLSTSTD